MKKYLCGIFAFVIGLGAFCGCDNQTLPVPEYPLGVSTVADALQGVGFLWTIEEEDSWFGREVQTMYALYKDDKLVASISSAIVDEERFLQVSFVSYYNDEHFLPEEEWENAIVFATLLYGGFNNTHHVYNHFKNDYDTKNTVRKNTQEENERRKRMMGAGSALLLSGQVWGHEEEARSNSEINGVNCHVRLERVRLDMPQECLALIQFASDLDTFNIQNSE